MPLWSIENPARGIVFWKTVFSGKRVCGFSKPKNFVSWSDEAILPRIFSIVPSLFPPHFGDKGKSFSEFGQYPPFLLIADDAIGGFFALNGGAFGKNDLGKIYYFSPETLEWDSLKIGYSEFVNWAFSGDLGKFYKGLRWSNWENDLKTMDADQAISFAPFLWTKFGRIEELSRKPVPVEEVWGLQMDIKDQLSKKEGQK